MSQNQPVIQQYFSLTTNQQQPQKPSAEQDCYFCSTQQAQTAKAFSFNNATIWG
jgi:hypothetical protein